MSCWVVPAIAAELWGVTVDRILAGVRDGTVPAFTENGFVFVDVAPSSNTPPSSPPASLRPPTYVTVTRDADEVDWVVRPSAGPIVSPEEAALLLGGDAAPPEPELPPLDVEEDATPLPPRQMVRAAVARLRTPPPRRRD